AVAESGGVTTTITLNHDLPVGNSQTQRLGLTYTGATVINFSDAPGTIVGTLQATLSDVVNVNYRYYHDDVLSFGQRTLLAVDEFSGVVSIAESELNDGTAPNLADTVSVFVAGFRVEEPGNNALRLGYATVTVAVNPQLILAPAFTAVGFGANDNSAGITLATAAVAGVANTAAYTYSIVGIDSAPAGHLAISVSGGTIGIVITAAYDAAANAGVYEYRINASAGNKTASATLTVNVLNSAQLVYLPRRAPQNSDTVGQVIGTLSVIGSFPTVTNSVGPDRFVASALSFQAGEPFPFGVDETTGIMSVTVSSLSAYTVPIFVNFAVERILTVSVSQTTPQATMTIALSQVRQLFDFSATPPPPPQFTRQKTLPRVKFSSLRAILPAVLPSKAATAALKQSCR
ncbi:MAG: hypothetical protein HAW59_00020, partial [Betaproteobacteria bacterium]|nr:hypothetical protein [Betaproteobacteria bacterium]